MKRLFTIGLGQWFASFIPVIVWALIGKLHGDVIASGMIYTYPYQFVYAVLWHVTYVGNIKYELKCRLGIKDYSKTSILIGITVGIIIAVISLYNIDTVGCFLGVDSEMGRWAFLFGLCSMAIDWPAYYLGEQYQYYGEDKKGTRFIISWYVLKFILICVTAISVFNYKSAVIFVLAVQSIVLIVLVFKHSIPEKFRFSICNGVKYTIQDIVHGIFMAVIFLFGIHDISIGDVSILAAYNLMVLCTDTQWDVAGSAVNVAVTGYVCNGTFEKNRRKIFRQNMLFAAILAASSYAMFGIMMLLYRDINPVYVILFITIELSTMVPYGITDTMSAYINVQYPSVWTGLLTVLKYVVRLTSQMIILSPYAISIAIPVCVVVDFPFRVLLYRRARQKSIIKDC